jgi:molybdate transport system substrate-binding protein
MKRGRIVWQRFSLAVFCLFFFAPPSFSGATPPKEIRIAAAADLQFVMPELVQQFERGTNVLVLVSYGSSGNFFAQIQNGAPFDLFFSADLAYPRKLEVAGLCEPSTLFTYAVGRLVIWTPSGSPLEVRKKGWQALLDSRVQKISIANPAYAPYGQAAVSALQKAGIFDQVKDKIVYGENISQAAQFVQLGSAQAGILALSLALSPAMKNGHWWEFPSQMYPSLEQGAVMLKTAKDKENARAFLDFVRGPSGHSILRKWGFQAPSAGSNSDPSARRRGIAHE